MILLLVGFTMRMLLFSDAANANVGIEQLSNKAFWLVVQRTRCATIPQAQA
ncbi:Polycystin-2 [Durusdinium trenchii]